MNTLSLAGPSPLRRSAAFTLLELLVVISIIAVLAGILLPVTSSVMDSARKTEAKSTVSQICTAVKSFQTDYGVYPNPDNLSRDVTWKSDTNDKLFAILRATDVATNSVNTRRVVYFEGKDAKNSNNPKSGFATVNKTNTVNKTSYTVNVGALVDPWGAGYCVRCDSGYTDAVVHPYSNDADGANDAAGDTGVIRSGVIAWSYGKDGVKGNNGSAGASPNYTYGDDVVSWQ